MNYVTSEGQPLTATDIKAIKHADYVQFVTDQEKGSRIIANLRPEHSETGFHESRTIIVDGFVSTHPSYINDKCEKRTATNIDGRECYVDLDSYSIALESLLKLLRVNDKIELVWSADGRCNQYAAQADLHVDTFYVRILRYNKRSEDWNRYITLHMEQSITPDNTARMIRVIPWL